MKQIIVAIIIGAGMIIGILSGNGIEQTTFEATVELGDEFVFNVSDFFDASDEQADEFEIDLSGLDTSKIGSYELQVTYKNRNFIITVNVEDTTAPALTIISDLVFTNEPDNLDMEQIAQYEDLSGCTATLRYGECFDEIKVYDGETLAENFSAAIEGLDYEAAYESGIQKPEEEGYYLAIVCVEDEAGNASYDVIAVICDYTAPTISGLSDITLFLDEEGNAFALLTDAIITDNVDGEISALYAESEIELTDEENNVYTLTVSYTDLAGNEMVETQEYILDVSDSSSSDSGSSSSDSGGSSGSGSSSSGSGSSSSGSTETISNGYYDDYAQQVLALVNEERAAEGLSALTMNETVMAAAKVRAKELVTSFSHTRPDGSSCVTALTDAGISYSKAGENVAYGQMTPEAVVQAWMNSDGHRANILDSDFTQIGIGCYYEDGVYYWVQLFIG